VGSLVRLESKDDNTKGKGIEMSIVLDQYITVTPGVRSGKPVVAGTRITVADIAIWHCHQGIPLEELAHTYQLSKAAVYAAMAYYYEHQLMIDSQTEESQHFIDGYHRKNPSLLQQKLMTNSKDV
jgi:uncharacterized protein (DUF433 family)